MRDSQLNALLPVVRSVRRRWRMRIAVRGLAIVASAGLVVFLVSAFAMDRLHFTSVAVLAFQLLAYGAVLVLAVRYLILPLRRRVTDQQVALYLEEHERTLDGQVITAVEAERGGPAVHSPALMERVIERAIERCAAVDGGRRIEQRGLARSGGVLAGATLTALAVLLLNPGFVRNSTPFLLSPWAGGSPENPYAIVVRPGDSLVARGADLKVTATLVNFDAEDVEIALRAGEDAWERWTMSVDDETGEWTVLLFDLADSTEYYVEAGGVRSDVYRITVTDLPYVREIALEYRFPAYTGLSVVREEGTGDIAALIGTRVEVHVLPTIAVAGAALALDGDTIPMAVGETGDLTGTLTVRANGSYRILMTSPAGGTLVPASPAYFIDALLDQPPIVRITTPGRDMNVTAVDELFTEVTVEDDFGIRAVELIYSVNGGAEDTLALYDGRGGRKHVTAGHTFYLEELDLVPGDFVSYYARARDARRGAAHSVTDIYFLAIRPFDRRWQRAEQGGGGGGGMSVGELSQRQRQIIAGTFNLVRDSAQYALDDYRENLATLALAQGRLREEVETLVARIAARGVVDMDSTFRPVAEELPQAVEAMEAAEGRLGRREPAEALPPERQALQHLQRAEQAFRDRQVSQGQPGGGNAGGGANAEDLADLFELELDRIRNQYEQLERGAREAADREIDAVLERLRQLAQRQQQENERLRAQAQSGNRAGQSGTGQRRMADETEELARRLERLSREQSRPELTEAARRIRQAADAMRRAGTQGSNSSSQGNRAVDQLREARRQLERNRSADLQRDVADALRRAERLAEQERGVTQDVERLSNNPVVRRDQARRLIQRKEQMAAEVADLEAQLDQLARDARADQPEAARLLRDAAAGMRDARLRDKINYSRGVVAQRDSAYARNFEEQIGADIENLRRRLEEALGAIGESREQRVGRALDQARDVARALESLGERARAAQGEGQGNRAAGEPGRRLDPNAQRQFQRELRERAEELRDLRGQLRDDGVDVSQLDDVINRLGRFDNQGAIGDPRAIEQLQTEIVQGLKEFEFVLRRQLLETGEERLFLSGTDDVPDEYREMVEEYYRRLAERR